MDGFFSYLQVVLDNMQRKSPKGRARVSSAQFLSLTFNKTLKTNSLHTTAIPSTLSKDALGELTHSFLSYELDYLANLSITV